MPLVDGKLLLDAAVDNRAVATRDVWGADIQKVPPLLLYMQG